MSKKRKSEEFRNWLIKNRVFFEIPSVTLLGIASIIVSILSFKTSHEQLELSKLEHQPLLSLTREYPESTEIIKINNVGYHLFQPEVKTISYLKIEDYLNKENNTKYNYFVKVADYFKLNYTTDNTTGNISSIISSDYAINEKRRIQKSCSNLFGNKFESIGIETCIRIDFKDETGEDQSKYFKIDSFSTIEISEKTYKLIIEDVETHNIGGQKYLQKLDGSKVLSQINQIFKDKGLMIIKDSDV